MVENGHIKYIFILPMCIDVIENFYCTWEVLSTTAKTFY